MNKGSVRDCSFWWENIPRYLPIQGVCLRCRLGRPEIRSQRQGLRGDQHCCLWIQGRYCFSELLMLTTEKSFPKSHNRASILLGKKILGSVQHPVWSSYCIRGTWLDLDVWETWIINHHWVSDLQANTRVKKPEEKNNAICCTMLKHDYSYNEGVYEQVNIKQVTLYKGFGKDCDYLPERILKNKEVFNWKRRTGRQKLEHCTK